MKDSGRLCAGSVLPTRVLSLLAPALQFVHVRGELHGGSVSEPDFLKTYAHVYSIRDNHRRKMKRHIRGRHKMKRHIRGNGRSGFPYNKIKTGRTSRTAGAWSGGRSLMLWS